MAKYEFCWTVSPSRQRLWQETLEIDGLKVEVLSDRIVVRADSADVSADKLRIHAGHIVAGLVRAMSFHENLSLTYEFSCTTTTLADGRSHVAIEVTDSFEVRDNVTSEVYSYVKCGAVIVKHSDQVNLQNILLDFERLRASRQYSAMLEFITAFRSDPERKLAPLYNILEVAEGEFCGRKLAARALGLNQADLGDLGKTANDPTIRTARHPGNNAGVVRDITAAELTHCERIAEEIIHAYAKRIPLMDPGETKDSSSLTTFAPPHP
jgi:hypothetical protein